MLNPDEKHPLSDFQRNAPEYLEQLKSDGKPHVLTVDGKPAAVIQDAEAYEKLLAELDRAEAIAGIKRGLNELADGQGRPAKEAFEDMRARRNIPQSG